MAGRQEILMLEAPTDASLQAWRSTGGKPNEIVNALPYVDDDYDDPWEKAKVDRLAEEEMRRSNEEPADFLKDLPPLPKSQF